MSTPVRGGRRLYSGSKSVSSGGLGRAGDAGTAGNQARSADVMARYGRQAQNLLRRAGEGVEQSEPRWTHRGLNRHRGEGEAMAKGRRRHRGEGTIFPVKNKDGKVTGYAT